jgi:hypothetical protein
METAPAYTGAATVAGVSVHDGLVGTPLQVAFEAFVEALEQLERLPSRERAVALHLARRRLARALVAHACVLGEWGLAA